jgi:membrane protease YdiL (CAAX protease family)
MNQEKSFITLNTLTNKLPGFYQALLLIAIAGLVSLAIGFAAQMAVKAIPGFALWVMFVSYTLSFWLVLVIAQKWWQVLSFEISKVEFVVYILLVPLVLALSVLLEGVVSLIPMPESIQKLFEEMVQLNFQGYLTIGIAAPILEELIFRGVVLKKFLQKYSPTKAIVLSSVIFGIAHMNPWQFVAAFSIGLVIGWIYWKTNSIWPGIFMHFLNNSFSFYLAKKYESINITFQDVIGNTIYYISLLIICVLIVYAIYLIMDKYFKKLELSVSKSTDFSQKEESTIF